MSSAGKNVGGRSYLFGKLREQVAFDQSLEIATDGQSERSVANQNAEFDISVQGSVG